MQLKSGTRKKANRPNFRKIRSISARSRQSPRDYGNLREITAISTRLRQSPRDYGNLHEITAISSGSRQSPGDHGSLREITVIVARSRQSPRDHGKLHEIAAISAETNKRDSFESIGRFRDVAFLHPGPSRFFTPTKLPHSGHRSGVARRSYPQARQHPILALRRHRAVCTTQRSGRIANKTTTGQAGATA
jgi:hypothetical protein